MLKLWGPSGDQTPKAERKNPFDSLSPAHPPSSGASAIARSHIPPHIQTNAPQSPSTKQTQTQNQQSVNAPDRTGSSSSSLQPSASGARTPTTPSAHHHHHLLHLPQHHDLTPASSNSRPTSPNRPLALPTTFLSTDPPNAATMTKPPPLSRNATLTAVPTVAPPAVSNLNALSHQVNSSGNLVSLAASAAAANANAGTSPQSNPSPTNGTAQQQQQQQPPSSSSNGGQSRGQLHVKLIQARALNVKSIHSRPYVVVQFENNEFVSRDPISDKEKEVKGTAQPLSRNNSSNALASLAAASGITRAFEAAVNRGLSRAAATTPSGLSTPTSEKPAGGLLFGSSMSPHNPTWKHEVSFDVTSDQSHLTFNVYDRTLEENSFLGFMDLKPAFVHDQTVDQWYKLQSQDGEPVSAEIRVQVTYERFETKKTLSLKDFEFLKLIGRGTFGRVFQVRKKDTKRIYAMKILSKKEIVAKKEVAHTIGERKILQTSLECPFLVGLKFSFQSSHELYLVTDFKSGGELFWHLQKEQRFTEERARFYIAELVLALEHLHKYDIVYRDLKPENILLDATGHVALCDFGLSKPDLPSDQLTNTFCGTTEYLAPEVLLDDSGYSKLVDFWSLGVLLFEMCCGWSPFYAEDTQTMYRNICFGKIRFPRGVIGEDGKQFVKGLLNRNPRHRLGANRDAEELKEHPFFKSIDWKALAAKQVTPPFKPSVESDESTANFDPEFTEADLREHGIDVDEDTEEDHLDDAFNQLTLNPGLAGSETSTATTASEVGDAANGKKGGSGGAIGVKQKAGNGGAEPSSPITNSVQEKFIGFTYMGESMIAEAAGMLGRDRERDKLWQDGDDDDLDLDGNVRSKVDDDEEDEWEDEDDVGPTMKSRRRLGSELQMDA